MVDTHGHYVFGIDDGASTIEMSVAMIRAAYKQGVQDIICTSHSWGNYQAYQERIGELRDYIAAEKYLYDCIWVLKLLVPKERSV